MEEIRIYSTDLSDGDNKRVLQNHKCRGCGIEPYFDLNQSINGISSYNLKVDGWGLVNEVPYCPTCLRGEKIKKILNG